jgi:hypothetical protein
MHGARKYLRGPRMQTAQHVVFISYSSHSSAMAGMVCQILEANGVKCWVAPRDIEPGAKFVPAIVQAIQGSQVLLLIFCSKSAVSEWVAKEVHMAVDYKKRVIPLRIENVEEGLELKPHLIGTQWEDATHGNLEIIVRNLVPVITGKKREEPPRPPRARSWMEQFLGNRRRPNALRWAAIWVLPSGAVAMVAAPLLWFSFQKPKVANVSNGPQSPTVSPRPEPKVEPVPVTPNAPVALPVEIPKAIPVLIRSKRAFPARADDISKEFVAHAPDYAEITHVVLKEDTIESVADYYNSSAGMIRWLNPLPDSQQIPLARLLVPVYTDDPSAVLLRNNSLLVERKVPLPLEWYQVKPGDSISVIAKKRHMTSAQVMWLNKLPSSRINAGDRLKVLPLPEGGPTPK